jgi:hypothetical protein
MNISLNNLVPEQAKVSSTSNIIDTLHYTTLHYTTIEENSLENKKGYL